MTGVAIECVGCGFRPPVDRPPPLSCSRRVELSAADHVLELRPALAGVELPSTGDINPFLRYRRLSAIYQLALARGATDQQYADVAGRLDEHIEAIWGHGFEITPYRKSAELGVYYKDETVNVGGSHKARHLMGIAIHLELSGEPDETPLAIASCGNAALAAAVVARAAERPLRVFIPPDAGGDIRASLTELGATIEICPRREGDPPGDPCVHAFDRAVAGGALPFACQGHANGLTIDGGKTLGYELAAQHRDGRWPPLSDLFIQIGGGALASAVWQALRDARELGAIDSLPRLRPVQTASCAPMIRALEVIAASDDPRAALDRGRHKRDELMWPWAVIKGEPVSAARGILDDETYDWWQIARGVLDSGGSGVVVSEDQLAAGRGAAVNAGISVSTTGAAGYSGALASERGEQTAVLLTGVGVGGGA